ncbi:MAG: D-aminoacylase [Pirellulales bacterium]
MYLFRKLLIVWIIVFVHARLAHAEDDRTVDILFKGGTIIDGSGGQPFEGDVAVRDERIVAVGDIDNRTARQTIDCKGFVICPGFIDLHNHSDHSITSADVCDARCYLTQGCTTLVTGNCGGGRGDVGKFYDELAADGVGINIAHLIPHGSIRDQVMGKVRRAPNDDELEKMKTLADAGMRQGAWGMSTGLQYVPGAYADTDELVVIASVVSKHGGIYASHMRDESDELLESIEEVIEIAQRANLHCHISHLKSSNRRNWGKVRLAARVIEEAQQKGLRITADQYPYNASSTSMMAMLLPDEEREGGEEATAERLQNPDQLARVRSMVAEALEARGQLMIASFSKKPEWVGMMIADVAKAEGREPVDIGLDLLLDGKAQGVNFGMDEADVRFVMTLPWVATASDGSSKIDDGTRPHPRSYGTFPRKIGRYSIQEKILPLPAAIRSASGLPADILGMTDRGYVRDDFVADLVVFHPEELEDRATYEKPFEPSVGIRWLLVNGKIAIADGVPQEVLAGRPLRRTIEPAAGGQ